MTDEKALEIIIDIYRFVPEENRLSEHGGWLANCQGVLYIAPDIDGACLMEMSH